jgi:ketosteroid isomerase-like protein
MKKLIFTLCLILTAGLLYGQENDHDNNEYKKMSNSEDVEAVKEVLKSYKNALENLDVSDTQKLFSKNADIFESGSYEGTYQDYLDHHIGPELGHFKEFTFSDYKVDVRMEGNIAVAYETYNYKIVTSEEDSRTINRQGVATSVLKKMDGTWKIIQQHGSSRAAK